MKAENLVKKNQPKRVYLETLGCAKNIVDSEIMHTALEQAGYALVQKPEEGEILVVNTCAFLTSASEESLGRILDLAEYKESGVCEKLVCAGCLSERYRDELFREIEALDGILGSGEFSRLPSLLDALYKNPQHKELYLKPKPYYTHFTFSNKKWSSGPWAYVKISEGCSNMCSFCTIPYLRGYFSSRSVESVVEEISFLTQKGVKEINIISQDTSSYGKDKGTSLKNLIQEISKLPQDFWLRLFYCYPNTLDTPTLQAMQDCPQLVPYLDMPLQHIDDGVLKGMNRRISGKELLKKVENIKKHLPQTAFRTTLMVGFPGEGEKEFSRLLSLVEEGLFEHLGVFCYSVEDKAPSHKLGDPVPRKEKEARKRALLAAQRKVSLEKNKARVGTVLPVLVEGWHPETQLLVQGRAPFQGPEVDGVVMINQGNLLPGQIHPILITEAHPYDLLGKPQE